jgi:mitochondrial fission protein ELM1
MATAGAADCLPAARAEAEPEPPLDPVAAAEAVQRDTDIINLATEVLSSSRPLPHTDTRSGPSRVL